MGGGCTSHRAAPGRTLSLGWQTQRSPALTLTLTQALRLPAGEAKKGPLKYTEATNDRGVHVPDTSALTFQSKRQDSRQCWIDFLYNSFENTGNFLFPKMHKKEVIEGKLRIWVDVLTLILMFELFSF